MTTLPSNTDRPITNAVIASAVKQGVSAGVWRVKAWLAGFACLCVAAVVVVGCNSKLTPADVISPPMQSIDAASNSVGKAEAEVGGIAKAVPLVEPYTAEPGIPILRWMSETAQSALANLAQAQIEHSQAKTQLVERDRIHGVETAAFIRQVEQRDRELAKVKGDIFYRAGIWIRWGFWLIVAWIGVAFVLRIAALFIPGWTGASLAKIAVFMFGVVTGGLSWFTSWADNAYMDRAAKLNPQ